MQFKTIEELNQKAWYRLLKVLYGLSFVFLVIKSLDFVTKEVVNEDYIILGFVLYILYPLFIYVAFEIVRRLFFYIIFGTMKPTDDTYFIKIRKHKKSIIIASVIIIIALAIGVWDAIRVDNERYKKRNSSITPSISDLPDLPPLPPLPKLPSLPKL